MNFSELANKTVTLPIWPTMAIKEKTSEKKDDKRIKLLNDKYEINSATSLGSLCQLDAIRLSSIYYSKCPIQVDSSLSYNPSETYYKVKPLHGINLELPCVQKDSIQEPTDNQTKGEIFYINPVSETKIISDPRLPNMAPVEDAPTGKWINSKYIVTFSGANAVKYY